MRPARKGPETLHAAGGVGQDFLASMRPARKGPETLTPLPEGVRAVFGFNEAGPQGAGNVDLHAAARRG